ncbi:hypothetical protein Pcinc_041151 [Petrolisthes cinctipes]|uniref:Uncharacterized protein n=1 Tax=Petrolisthes cinctipes TaxID=88211 RepID=A0AAE1BLE9_PETCI|nr:hypothetical protein Pcinc_041151 [Petrolisthes cinctipes]
MSLAADSSPSSTRVQLGSKEMLYIDEGMDPGPETPPSDPLLLRHEPLPEDDQEQPREYRQREDGQDPAVFEAEERQRIVKSDDENEFVIVDDAVPSVTIPGIQLEGEEISDTGKAEEQVKQQKEADGMGTEEPLVTKVDIEETPPKEDDAVPSGGLKIEETVAEIEKVEDGPADLQIKESIAPTTTPESSGDALDAADGTDHLPEEKADADTKNTDSSSSSSDKEVVDQSDEDLPPPPPPLQPPPPAPGKQVSGSSSSSSSSSDDEFVEVRPESENVQDAQRMSAQVTSNPPESDEKTSADVVEARIDLQKYYLKKKASNPPALPPRGKNNK